MITVSDDAQIALDWGSFRQIGGTDAGLTLQPAAHPGVPNLSGLSVAWNERCNACEREIDVWLNRRFLTGISAVSQSTPHMSMECCSQYSKKREKELNEGAGEILLAYIMGGIVAKSQWKPAQSAIQPAEEIEEAAPPSTGPIMGGSAGFLCGCLSCDDKKQSLKVRLREWPVCSPCQKPYQPILHDWKEGEQVLWFCENGGCENGARRAHF